MQGRRDGFLFEVAIERRGRIEFLSPPRQKYREDRAIEENIAAWGYVSTVAVACVSVIFVKLLKQVN